MIDDAENPLESKFKPTRAETIVISLLSLVMIILPILEIILRKVRDAGVPNGSIFVQHAGMWLGFLGGVIATGAGKHLGLASTSFIPEGRWRTAALVYGSMVASVTCMVLAYASLLVIQAHRQGSDRIAGNIPAWWSECIVPTAFVLMTLRFIWHAPGKTKAELHGGWLGRLFALGACIVVGVALWIGRENPSVFFWPGIALIASAFLLGAPIFVAMSTLAMLLFSDFSSPIAALPEESLRLVQNPTLPAIPLFTLAGYVLAAGKASERLVGAFKSVFGWMPGGVALMATVVCAYFTTLTGGSGVTILALGGLLMPALLKDKYPEGFSLGLLTAAGSLGLLFTPSLPVVLYGAVAGVAPERLYRAGFLPGVLLIAVVFLYAIRVGIVAKTPRTPFSWKDALRQLWAAKFDLGLPVVIVVAFKSGWATPVEAAAVGAAYAILVELLLHHELKPFRDLPRVMTQSATLVGAVVILLAMALGLTQALVDRQMPEALLEWVQAHIHTQWGFLLALNVILLVLGSVFEIFAAIIVLAPLVAPLGAAYHVDPVHLGVVFLANLELGFLFPPMGLNLLLAASRFNKPLPTLYRQAIPFLIIMAIGVLIITYVPWLTGMSK